MLIYPSGVWSVENVDPTDNAEFFLCAFNNIWPFLCVYIDADELLVGGAPFWSDQQLRQGKGKCDIFKFQMKVNDSSYFLLPCTLQCISATGVCTYIYDELLVQVPIL